MYYKIGCRGMNRTFYARVKASHLGQSVSRQKQGSILTLDENALANVGIKPTSLPISIAGVLSNLDEPISSNKGVGLEPTFPAVFGVSDENRTRS